ncbi:hypothetical protein EYR40_004826 [Pleurotus pulmonarius]|nr:hypothetical protein EYR36_006794 [Pleurotus pulmonarius]KAF4601487.1 hypothetical protein EYR38_006141 [Pleurotus pulmonarius]KAF4601628.1 hypothetical protein EYR40_004826 [Pleurotus pulmonarius]
MAAAITFHETTQPVWPSQRVSVLMKYTVMILEDESFEGYYHHFKHEANGLLDGVVNLCRSRKPEMASLAMACENTRVRLGSLLEPLRPNVYKDFQVDYDNALAEDATTEGWSPLSLFSKNSRKELGGKIKNVRIIHSKGSLDDESDWENNFEDYYALDPVYLILWRAMLLRSVKVHSNPRIYGFSKAWRKWVQLSFQQSIQDVGAGPFYIFCDRQLPITFGDQLYGNMFKQQNGQSQYLLKRPSGELVRLYTPSAGGMMAEWSKDSHSGRLPDYVDAFNSILLEVDKSWSIRHADVSGMIPEDNRFQKLSMRMPEPDIYLEKQERKDTTFTLCDSMPNPHSNAMPVLDAPAESQPSGTIFAPPKRADTDATLVDSSISPTIPRYQRPMERTMPPHIRIPHQKDIPKFSPATPNSTPLLTPQSGLAGMMMVSAAPLAAIGGGHILPMRTPVSPESAGKKHWYSRQPMAKFRSPGA